MLQIAARADERHLRITVGVHNDPNVLSARFLNMFRTLISNASISRSAARRAQSLYARRERRGISRASGDDAPLIDERDWRSFRARLVEQEVCDEAQSRRVSEGNLRRLRLDSPQLAEEGVWCHATPMVERGGLIIATLACARIKKSERHEEVSEAMVVSGMHAASGLM